MKKLAYVYENPLKSKELTKDYLYDGERVMYKNENIKIEDDKSNKQYETICYYTNFRIIALSEQYIYDIPFSYISSHSVKKPMFYGSSYIYIEFPKKFNLKAQAPRYILDNYSSSEIESSNYHLPGYVMVKFRSNVTNIDESFEILKLAINGMEYNNSYKKKEIVQTTVTIDEPQQPTWASNVSGVGMQRLEIMCQKRIEEQNKMISGSFADIQSLKANAKAMIDLAQQLQAKLSNTQNSTEGEINSVLSGIGFINPVTKEVAGSKYYQELAEQINAFFTEYFLKNPGTRILTLIEAYCIYNRARGINTISPKDMKQAIDNFSNVRTNIILKNLNNEMIVLHTKEYSSGNIFKVIKTHLLQKLEGFMFLTINEFAEVINVKNVILAKILLEDLLVNGMLVLDESDLDVRYYLNTFLKS